MKKLVFFKAWSTNPDATPFRRPILVNKTYINELEEIFKIYKYKIELSPFEDGNHVVISNRDYNYPFSTVWDNVLNSLKDNGFEFSSAIKKYHEFVKDIHVKELERKRIESEELERKKREDEEKKQIEKLNMQAEEYGLLCTKNDCLTTRDFCQKECKYYKLLNGNCGPTRVKIIRG